MARMLIETFLVVFCVQTFGLAHSMDKNVSVWYQEGGHVLIKVRWVNATSDVNVYHDSQYYNSPRKQIATCRENGNNENVCVANQEHSEDYVIWGERKRAYLVIEKLSNKTIGKYSFEDRHNTNNNVVIDVQHNRIDKLPVLRVGASNGRQPYFRFTGTPYEIECSWTSGKGTVSSLNLNGTVNIKIATCTNENCFTEMPTDEYELVSLNNSTFGMNKYGMILRIKKNVQMKTSFLCEVLEDDGKSYESVVTINDGCFSAGRQCTNKRGCCHDENWQDCAGSVSCNFTASDCGYETSSGSCSNWIQKRSHTYTLKKRKFTVKPAVGDYFLMTQFPAGCDMRFSAATSMYEIVNEDHCLYFQYVGTVKTFSVMAHSATTNKTDKYWFAEDFLQGKDSWRPGQLDIPAGTWEIQFRTTHLRWTNDVDYNEPFVAIDDIILQKGKCKVAIVGQAGCVSAGRQCKNEGGCCHDENRQDRAGSVSCDFTASDCGYETSSSSCSKWIRKNEHTYTQKKGELIVKKDAGDHFFMTQFPAGCDFGFSAASSIYQTVLEDSCLLFQYAGTVKMFSVKATSAAIYKTYKYWVDEDVSKGNGNWLFGQMEIPVGTWEIQFRTFLLRWTNDVDYNGPFVAIDDIILQKGECTDANIVKRQTEAVDENESISENEEPIGAAKEGDIAVDATNGQYTLVQQSTSNAERALDFHPFIFALVHHCIRSIILCH